MDPEFEGASVAVGRLTTQNKAEGFQDKARRVVFQYVMSQLDKSDPPIDFTVDGVYVVWFSKTLKNWKALVSTTLPDQMYYEVTYDGENKRVYLDAYKKHNNVTVLDDDFENGTFEG